jgi:hypothetical protein
MDSIRRQTLRDLATGDPAAARVPQVITLNPRRVARTMIQCVLDERPFLTEDEALAVVFVRDPDLRAAFDKFNLTKDDITPLERMTLDREPTTAAVHARREEPIMSSTTMTSTETFLQLAREERENNPKLTEHQSLALVSRKYPDLYAEVQREGAVDSAGISLATNPPRTGSPVTNPTAKTTPTIEPTKPSSKDLSSAPAAKATIERLAGVEIQATHCTYPVAVKRVMTPALRQAWEAQGKPKIFDMDLDDILRWGAADD